MDQYIGKLLDNRYEILELIGVGGMARVYKARCHWLNRYVAIKILRDDLAQDSEIRRRFHDESQAVAMLSHPNIVKIYDVSFGEDIQYLVMEYVNGITLKEYCEQQGKIPIREALHFVVQILRTLQHAHENGIVQKGACSRKHKERFHDIVRMHMTEMKRKRNRSGDCEFLK